MKINWGIIKFIVLLGLVVFLFSFTKTRNAHRYLSKIDVEFVDENEPFITLPTVNKLLIQSKDSVTGILKEMVVLKEAENRLLENPMIRDAQVYITVDGTLGAKIEQRNPVARVAAATDYYVDADGKKMPLSAVFTARVPLITGSSKNNFSEITPLLLKMNEDEFMKQNIIGVHVAKSGNITLQLRKHDINVLFGKPNDIERKVLNFKAFYQKIKMDSMLNNYKTVNLKFGDQVVATKK